MQVLDEQVGSSGSSCGRQEILQKYTLMTATSWPSHDRKLLDLKGIACSWANHFICWSLVLFPNIDSNAQPVIEAKAQMLEQVQYLLIMEVVSPYDT